MNTVDTKNEYTNDCTILRPFDLEAAKRGEPICLADGRPAKFLAHEQGHPYLKEWSVIVLGPVSVLTHREDGQRWREEPSRHDLRMAPLFWLEGKPVYKGDKLKHDCGCTIVVHHLNTKGHVCQYGIVMGYWIGNLSWPPTEEWVAFDAGTAKIGDNVRVEGYGDGVIVHGPNQLGEFVFDLVGHGYIVVGEDAHEVKYKHVTTLKTK